MQHQAPYIADSFAEGTDADGDEELVAAVAEPEEDLCKKSEAEEDDEEAVGAEVEVVAVG